MLNTLSCELMVSVHALGAIKILVRRPGERGLFTSCVFCVVAYMLVLLTAKKNLVNHHLEFEWISLSAWMLHNCQHGYIMFSLKKHSALGQTYLFKLMNSSGITESGESEKVLLLMERGARFHTTQYVR
jgi:hypothetical protein